MTIFGYVIVFVYIFYVSFESFGLFARNGGYLNSSMSVGLAIQNQIFSLNRFVGFLIAPMIGFYVDSGMSAGDVYRLGVIGNLVGGLALVLVFYKWGYLTSFFYGLVKSILDKGYSLKVIYFYLFKSRSDFMFFDKKIKIKYNFLLAQAFTTGLAMPSLFVFNILAIKNPDYSSTLLQMTTIISGLGNLMLNFYTIPLLAVQESRNDDVINKYKSIFIGKVIGIFLLSPIVISIGAYM